MRQNLLKKTNKQLISWWETEDFNILFCLEAGEESGAFSNLRTTKDNELKKNVSGQDQGTIWSSIVLHVISEMFSGNSETGIVGNRSFSLLLVPN